MTEPLTALPVDILGELKAEFEHWDIRDGVTAVVSILLLRDAISEIEALRAGLDEALRALSACADSLVLAGREVAKLESGGKIERGAWQAWTHPANSLRWAERVLATSGRPAPPRGVPSDGE